MHSPSVELVSELNKGATFGSTGTNWGVEEEERKKTNKNAAELTARRECESAYQNGVK